MDQQMLDLLSLIAGAFLSVLVEIPAVKQYYDVLTDGQKRVAMGGLLILAAGLLYGVTCAGLLDLVIPGSFLTCDRAGLAVLLRALFFALASNQSTFGLAFKGRTPKPRTFEG